jgi:hypothetical protein
MRGLEQIIADNEAAGLPKPGTPAPAPKPPAK